MLPLDVTWRVLRRGNSSFIPSMSSFPETCSPSFLSLMTRPRRLAEMLLTLLLALSALLGTSAGGWVEPHCLEMYTPRSLQTSIGASQALTRTTAFRLGSARHNLDLRFTKCSHESCVSWLAVLVRPYYREVVSSISTLPSLH